MCGGHLNGDRCVQQQDKPDPDEALDASTRLPESSANETPLSGVVETDLWIERRGEGPLMAAALHAGHEIRGELLPLLTLDAATRAREEDPYTDYWIKIVPTWLAPRRSRFEVDLNRERNEAVYMSGEVAWGMRLWSRRPNQKLVERSLREYDAFYAELDSLLRSFSRRYPAFVVLDLHSYNYRRSGPGEPPADPAQNPEVNIGTGSMDRARWGALVDRFMQDLRQFDFLGRHLDVRENVKFKGRQFAHWIHTHYPESACVLAIEFKKFYMDEWTGIGDIEQIQALRDALQSTVPGIVDSLERLSA